MYIANYKSVNSTNEFFSTKREKLDFPTQIEYKGERYSLNLTYIVSTKSQENSITDRAKEFNIPFNVKLV